MKDAVLGGRYVLGRLLGKGGMGAVYEARRLEDDERVAIKVIHRDLASGTVVARFEREVRVATAIDTPNIVRVLDAGSDAASGSPYMVMELLEGEDLDQVIERVGPLRPETALRIAAQACSGLQKAHESHVVHRDIKPANLFLARDADGRITVKVLDFGIAKVKAVTESEHTGLTRTGSMLGTPLYMSPEQARGIKSIDSRTDIWSMGVVLYRALSGRTPNEEAEAFGDLIATIISGPPPPLQDHAPWVSPEVAAVVHGALQQSPDGRYASMEAMRQAIAAIIGPDASLREDMLTAVDEHERALHAPKLRTTVGDTTGGDAPESTPEPSEPSTDALAPVAQEPPPAPRKRTLLGAVAAVAALLGVALSVYMVREPAPAAAPSPSARVVEAAPEPAPAPDPPIEPAPVAPAMHKVLVHVVPVDAAVQIDGRDVVADHGVVEIVGPLNSLHQLRLQRGGLEKTVTVVVTERVAVPDTVELGLATGGTGSARGAPPAKGTASAAASAPAAQATASGPAKPVMRETFE